ncbi:MAG TPA: LPS assembly protein LptD [Candidatus Saccharimonadales bacterium]|nr:LPS assembly protein LptD [Candidatus Saccharimonadales bacterium]
MSQAHPDATPSQQSPADAPQAARKPRISGVEGQPVTISARQQEKNHSVYTLRGEVEIKFQDYDLHADSITYDSDSGDIAAEGHLALDGGPRDLHLTASKGSFNLQDQTGKFYDVAGTTGAHFKGRNAILTSSSPLVFAGKIVEKTGDDVYVIHDGTVTSCELPHPKWTFSAGKIVVDLSGSARVYNTLFRIRGVPVLYLPYASHPVEKLRRQSGFLVPTFGTSSRKGTILGDSFFWAINRSADATIGAEYFSRRGWSLRDNFRLRARENSYLNFDYFGVLDRGTGTPRVNQGGEDVKLSGEAEFPSGFRGVASLNYLSSYLFRQAFTENFSQAVNSEVKSVVFLSKTFQGVSFNAFASRYQNFQSIQRGDLVTIFHAPGLEVSSVDQRLGITPVYWSFDGALEGLRRSEPGFDTPNLVGRFDIRPSVSVPLFYRGWTFRPEVSLQDTFYTETRVPSTAIGVAIQDAVNRRAFTTSLEMRPPTLGKVFDRSLAGRKVKHTVEVKATYKYTNGVENFPSIIRFDFRDLLSDTNEVQYGLTQRLYLKKADQSCAESAPETPADSTQEGNPAATAPPADTARCTPTANEVISWEVKQKYFFAPGFGNALVNGRRNVLTTTADFAGIAFLTEPRVFSPIVSRLRARTGANSDLQWELDYDPKKGRINASTTFATMHFGNLFVQGSHAFLVVPGELFVANPLPGPNQFNQLRALVGYGGPAKRGLSAAVSAGVDSTFSFLQYSSAQTSYNWDCCGLSFEYRRFALGSVRNENSFRFAFTLTNIGTFGNLKRQERLF